MDEPEEISEDTPNDPPTILVVIRPEGIETHIDYRLNPYQVAGAAWLLEKEAQMSLSANLAAQQQQARPSLVRAGAMPQDHLPPRKRGN